MLNYLEQKIENQRIKNITPLLSKENKIPIENESIDLLISINALHELADKEKMIQEIRWVLRQDGKAVIVDFNEEKNGFPVLKLKDLTYPYLIVFQR